MPRSCVNWVKKKRGQGGCWNFYLATPSFPKYKAHKYTRSQSVRALTTRKSMCLAYFGKEGIFNILFMWSKGFFTRMDWNPREKKKPAVLKSNEGVKM